MSGRPVQLVSGQSISARVFLTSPPTDSDQQPPPASHDIAGKKPRRGSPGRRESFVWPQSSHHGASSTGLRTPVTRERRRQWNTARRWVGRPHDHRKRMRHGGAALHKNVRGSQPPVGDVSSVLATVGRLFSTGPTNRGRRRLSGVTGMALQAAATDECVRKKKGEEEGGSGQTCVRVHEAGSVSVCMTNFWSWHTHKLLAHPIRGGRLCMPFL